MSDNAMPSAVRGEILALHHFLSQIERNAAENNCKRFSENNLRRYPVTWRDGLREMSSNSRELT